MSLEEKTNRVKPAPKVGYALDNLQKAHAYDAAHVTLDMLNIPRTDEHGSALTVSGRIDLLKVYVPDLKKRFSALSGTYASSRPSDRSE